jgi:WD40 repeat protein
VETGNWEKYMMSILKITLSVLLIALVNTGVQLQENATPSPGVIYVTAVAWSPDGSKIAAVGIQDNGAKGYIRIVDVASNEILVSFEPEPGGFSSVSWSPEGQWIAVGGYDQVIWIIDVATGQHIASLFGHRATVTDIDWSPDGKQLVSSGNWDGLSILWDMETYQQIRVIEEGNLFPYSIAFRPQSQQTAVGGEGGIRIYSKNGEQNPIWKFKNLNVATLKWNQSGSKMVFGTQTFPSITNPDLKFFSQIYIVDVDGEGNALASFATTSATVFGIDWLEKSGLIATHSIEGIVSVWDAATGQPLSQYEGTTIYPSHLNFSPYGGRLAYATPINALKPTATSGLLDSGIAIVVPVPSLKRIGSIAAECIADGSDASDKPYLLQHNRMSQLTRKNLPGFITQIEALPEGAIPAACAADLIAVAEAVIAHGE